MKKSNYILNLLMITLLMGCSSGVKSYPIDKKRDELVKTRPEVQLDSVGPCATFDDLNVADKENAEDAYVIFRDIVKQNNFEEAYPLWKTAISLAPASNGKVKYQFDDGIKILDHFFKKASSEEEKQKYIDSIMMIYDKRVECFGEDAYVAGRKAFDYYYKYRKYTTDSVIINLFKQAIDGKGEKADYFILNPFSSMLYAGVLEERIDYAEGSTYAEKNTGCSQIWI